MARSSLITNAKRAAVLAGVALALLHSPDATVNARDADCADTPSGLVAFVSDDRAVIVADASTGEVDSTIDIPDVDRLIPLRIPGYLIAVTAEPSAWLVNVATGTATTLDVADPDDIDIFTEQRFGLPPGPGQRFTVVGAGGQPYLLDTETATFTELRPLLLDTPDFAPLINPAVSSDERYLTVWNGFEQWLLPTADPAAARSLGTGSIAGRFSPDGTKIVYARNSDDPRLDELVIEEVDGGDAPRVLATGRQFLVEFAGSNERLIFVRATDDGDFVRGEVTTFDLVSGEQRVLFVAEVVQTGLFTTPGADNALVSLNDDAAGWQHRIVNLNTGALTELPELDGLQAVSAIGAPSVVLFPGVLPEETPGPGYYAVRLSSGTAHLLASIPDEPAQFGALNFSLDGSALSTMVIGEGASQLFYLDLSEDRSEVLGENASSLALSTDGCFVAHVPYAPGGSSVPGPILVGVPGAAEPLELGVGRAPVWITP